VSSFTKPHEGLAKCLEEFLKNPQFNNIPWDLEAVNDRATGERTPLKEIPKEYRFNYFCYRNNLELLLKINGLASRILRRLKSIITK
jgi:hypothetical protein